MSSIGRKSCVRTLSIASLRNRAPSRTGKITETSGLDRGVTGGFLIDNSPGGKWTRLPLSLAAAQGHFKNPQHREFSQGRVAGHVALVPAICEAQGARQNRA